MTTSNIYDYDTVYITEDGSPAHTTITTDDSTTITLGGNMASSGITTTSVMSSGVYTVPTGSSSIYDNSIIFSNGVTTPRTLEVSGDANVTGKLVVGGKDIGESLEKIEQRLAIFHPNKELESRWEKLKELADQYRELEKDILAKEEVFNILKK